MKINEIEQLLGIAKANIRFYEKEGLLTPSRTDRGYRDYTEQDISRLKKIIILRKLGLPVRQIQEVMDGCISLQEVLALNIQSLTEQIEALNGSLELTRQMQMENKEQLDVERYWAVINAQESQGSRYQSLMDDYLAFTELNYDWLLWPIPSDSLRNPKTLFLYILGFSTLGAFADAFLGKPFFHSLLYRFVGTIGILIVWTMIFIPIFLLKKHKPKMATGIMNFWFIGYFIAMIIILCVVVYMSVSR